MKKIAVIQSSFLPWKGYFDIIHDVDVFVFLEDVQYTVNDWRNRNRIKTKDGVKWITVPVKGGPHQMLYEAKVDYRQRWVEKHKKSLDAWYAAAEHYDEYRGAVFEIYDRGFERISELNVYAIRRISGLLGIKTEFVDSRDLKAGGVKDDRLIGMCRELGADHYLSGPSAKDYITEGKFENAGIKLEYKDYSGYPEYRQLWGGFDHHVSIIDLIFNCGGEAPHYIWGWRDGKQG